MENAEMTPEEYEDFVENGDWFIDTEKESWSSNSMRHSLLILL